MSLNVGLLGRGHPAGVKNALGVDEGVERNGAGVLVPTVRVSALYSTLTSSASSFTAGGAGVTLTFTAKDANNVAVQGYTPVPESGVTS